MLWPTLTNKIWFENVDEELPAVKPHMLLVIDVTMFGGNVIVTVFPLMRSLEILKLNDAVAPDPTAFDIINPV